MYKAFFGLEKSPFAMTPDPGFLFLTARHREALAGLLFAITCKKGFLVLTGDAGTGKTTLLRTMLRRVSPDRTLFSFVVHPTLTASEFLEYTLMDFGITDIPESKAQRLVLFQGFLLSAQKQGKIPVLVVDEAQKLSPELLEEIRLLTNFETSEHKLLQIILAGQNELSATLTREDMRQLRQRVAVRVTIGALTESEVRQYIHTRWTRAGGKVPPFAAEAIPAIAQCSGGIPRVINAVCDAALTNAFGSGMHQIGAEEIGIVARDLQLSIPTLSGDKSIDIPDQRSAVPLAAPVESASTQMAVPSVPAAPDNRPTLAFKTLDRYTPQGAKRPRFFRWAAKVGIGGA
jgi:general secretion pathway protein A